MSWCRVDDRPAKSLGKSVKVEAHYVSKIKDERGFEWKSDEDCDILEIVNKKTGTIIIRVGTENTSDFYPWVVSEFHPENI